MLSARSIKSFELAIWVCFFLSFGVPRAAAQPVWEATRLAEARVTTSADYIQSVRGGSTILRDATVVPFDQWYGSATLPDLRFAFLTPLNNDTGLLWGFGTGESGEKYWIEPGIKLGVITRNSVSENAEIVLRFSVMLGGYLKERSCVADYGAIGGVRDVNCRLAATPLRPEDTLNYLFDRPPGDQIEVSLRYTLRF